MAELLVFQTFGDKEQAMRVAATLENNGIFVSVEENIAQLDSNFIGQQFGNPFSLKIPGASFLEANKILMEYTVIDLNEVDKNYMLFSFSNEELIEVMLHKEEWGIYNYKLAELILAGRPVEIPKEKIAAEEAKAIAASAVPVKYDRYWIFIGYIFAALSLYIFYSDFGIFFFTFPTLFALVVGFLLFFSKKTLRTGARIWTYDRSSRIHGLIIFILTLLVSFLRFQDISIPIPHF